MLKNLVPIVLNTCIPTLELVQPQNNYIAKYRNQLDVILNRVIKKQTKDSMKWSGIEPRR